MRKKLLGLSRSRHYVRRGFSLAETLIALLILSIGLLAVAAVPVMSSKMALQATQRDQAMFLAVNTLDFLESQPYSKAFDSQDVVGEFTRRYTKPIFTETSPDNHVGAVTISWRGATGQNSISLERPLSKFSSVTREE